LGTYRGGGVWERERRRTSSKYIEKTKKNCITEVQEGEGTGTKKRRWDTERDSPYLLGKRFGGVFEEISWKAVTPGMGDKKKKTRGGGGSLVCRVIFGSKMHSTIC